MATIHRILFGVVVICLLIPVIMDRASCDDRDILLYDSTSRRYDIYYVDTSGIQRYAYFIPGNLVEPVIGVQLDVVNGEFRYDYLLANSPSARDSSYGLVWIECIDSFTVASLPTRWLLLGRGYKPLFASFMARGKSTINSGQPPVTLGVSTSGLPGVGRLLALGEGRTRGGFPQEVIMAGFPQWIADSLNPLLDLEIDAATVWTVCPVYIRTLTALDYLDSLIVGTDEVLVHGWLFDTAARDTVKMHLTQARDAIQSGNNEQAVERLLALKQFVAREYPSHLNNNAYQLYNAACEYLIARLQ